MVYSLGYRRPSYVSSSRDSLSGSEKPKSVNNSITPGSSGTSHGIPDAISFDRIVTGGTCPPVTLRDFMNFLKYVEFSAENLQFYLWFKGYVKRFEDLPESESRLSPEWTQRHEDAENAAYRSYLNQKPLTVEAAGILKAQNLAASETDSPPTEKQNPFNDSREFSSAHLPHESFGADTDTTRPISAFHSVKSGSTRVAELAFEDAGCNFPVTIQPFREEISRIITLYVSDGASRQLNLSSRERTALLKALEATTHPSAFRNVVKTVEWSLRRQAHPNFIRWSIGNGNRPRVIFARGLGIAGIISGILTALLTTLSTAGRGYRTLALIPFMIGIPTLIAAWKGMCVVLHGMHHRHLRPWELFEDDDPSGDTDLKKMSFDSLDSGTSYEDEPWVPKYEKRNIIRKVFDREVWVKEPALRQIQDIIFIQAVLAGLLLSGIIVGIFCAVPKGNFY
ncbi:hypothetical protein EJ08DRAFT_599184 [Tothia fuscella]|uniref:RGS domain-containing protein n=1 Tax=Tothia fuscella TaxID=1048955 RepID=A0A9P4NF58_9PEZI|nr:hypothetical protein EJ08DRAFT_599184 [Tothia fuscella]